MFGSTLPLRKQGPGMNIMWVAIPQSHTEKHRQGCINRMHQVQGAGLSSAISGLCLGPTYHYLTYLYNMVAPGVAVIPSLRGKK